MSPSSTTEDICESMFKDIDADLYGIACIDDAKGTPLYDSAIALMPGAKSMIMVAAEIWPEVACLVSCEKQVGAANASDLYSAHTNHLTSRLNGAVYQVADALRKAGFRALPLPASGTPEDLRFQRGIISFKHAAQAAGLGRIGHSSLLVTPQFGPRVWLAAVLTDAALPASKPLGEDPCANCGEPCVNTCPSGALDTPEQGEVYKINKFACCAFYESIGSCSYCLSKCPAGNSK
jgi:epoxyqueuosine reductase